MLTDETIAAQATASGKGGIGIVRISGAQASHVALELLGFVPKPRYASFCQFSANGKRIDQGIALYFPAPHSFTGEDVLELHGHGGAVVLDQLLKAVLACDSVRLARPGEFSERAFLNKKIDLAQAEAIADLINASSWQAAQSAMRSLQGEFSEKIQSFRDELIELRSFVEAAMDFPEEEIDFISEHNIQSRLQELITALNTIKSTAKQGVLLQEGINVVIAGEPNVGKSSLLNRLSGRDRAIVTDIAGTTRDILQESIHIDGIPLHIIDTAGLRETDDPVEQEGVRRARETIAQADVLLIVLDASQSVAIEQAVANALTNLDLPESVPCIVVNNKIDLLANQPLSSASNSLVQVNISAKTGDGLEQLLDCLRRKVGFNQAQEGVFIARRRHLIALSRSLSALDRGLEALRQQGASELLAENLRAAQQALNEITGAFSSDDLLGKIFADFCIGK